MAECFICERRPSYGSFLSFDKFLGTKVCEFCRANAIKSLKRHFVDKKDQFGKVGLRKTHSFQRELQIVTGYLNVLNNCLKRELKIIKTHGSRDNFNKFIESQDPFSGFETHGEY